MQKYDLDQTPIVLVQRRSRAAVFSLITAGTVVVGLFLLGTDPMPQRVVGLFLLVGGMLTVPSWIKTWIKPGRLSISPAGVVHEGPFRTRNWAWPNIRRIRADEGFVYIARNSRTAVSIPNILPPAWPLSIRELARLLDAARTRWS